MKKNLRRTIIRPSSKAFFREARTAPNVRFLDAVHGYIYSRWPYKYISLATGRDRMFNVLRPLMAWFEKILIRPSSIPAKTVKNTGRRRPSSHNMTLADTYHGKVIPLDLARELVTLDQDVSILNLESVLPFQKAKDLVLKNPDHIAVLDCPFRACELQGGKAGIHDTLCMGCGVCLSRCPEGVLQLIWDPERPLPLDLADLARENTQTANGSRACRQTDG